MQGDILLEQTLVILKPDAVQRRLLGRIIQRFEDKGLRIAAVKFMRISKDLAERHYAVHKGKPFYPSLIEYITSGPVVVMVLAGPQAIAVTRKMMGKTFGFEAEPGTIRGDYGISRTLNLIHGSDGPDSAGKEIALFFSKDEIIEFNMCDEPWAIQTQNV
jgi:nucleoside-diphosphate kinase